MKLEVLLHIESKFDLFLDTVQIFKYTEQIFLTWIFD